MSTTQERRVQAIARQLRALTEERNGRLRRMYKDGGYSYRDLGELAGLSHTAVKKIVDGAK